MAIKEARFFCGLGLPKTGTTFLAEYLRDHSEVFVPLIKELQVFNREFRRDIYGWMDDLFDQNLANITDKLTNDIDNEQLTELKKLLTEVLLLPHQSDRERMLNGYRDLFRNRVMDTHRTFGEFSTTYCVLPDDGLKLLDKAFPAARYIVVLRDPVDRFWSHAKHQARVKTNIDPTQCFHQGLDDLELHEMSDYRTIVGRIQRIIPSNRLHIALYEDLFLRHDAAALKAITDFLEIEFKAKDLSTVVYPGSTLAMPQNLKAEAVQRFQDSYRFGAELFGQTPEGWKSS